MLVSLALVCLALGGAVLESSDKSSGYKALSNFSDTLELIEGAYVEQRDQQQVLEGAFQGLIESLDPESALLTVQEVERLETLERSQGWLGLELTRRYGYGMVLSVATGSPAERAELATGDLIRRIDGSSSRHMNLIALRAKMAGEPETKVTLEVISNRSPEPREIELVRVARPALSIETRLIAPDVAYVRPSRFEPLTSERMAEALGALKTDKLSGLVIDLRSLAGGPMREGLEAADLFIADGSLGLVAGRAREDAVRRQLSGLKLKAREPQDKDAASYEFEVLADASALPFQGPIVILADAGTSGAAEIMASALVARRAARTLGSRTHGNASIQDIFTAGDGLSLRLTVATFYGPDGQTRLFGRGLEPSVEFDPKQEDGEHPGDPMLDKALELLSTNAPEKKAA